VFSIAALHRSQWVGLDGAPNTQTLSFNSPVSERVGIGLSIVNDEIGHGTNQDTYFDRTVSNTVPTSETGKLSFGIKAGGQLFNVDFNQLRNFDAGDASVFFETEHFDSSGLTENNFIASERRNLYLISGYVTDLNYDWKFKPAVLFKAVEGAPLQADFSPSFHKKDGFVFSTARDTGLISKNTHRWNKGAFLDLYTTTIDTEGNISSINKLSKNLNTKAHESSITFTKNGNTIYFTRNNSKNGFFSRDNDGVSRLKIYRGELINGKWKKIKPLPFNSDDYSVAHPTLSEDEKTLYFSSDMPGTLGQSDIFKVSINEDGSFGTPENLGNTINTEARETLLLMDILD